MREIAHFGALRVNGGVQSFDRGSLSSFTVMVRTIPSVLLCDALDQRRADQREARFKQRTWVYVINWQDRGPAKVGVAGDPTARRSELQCGNPYLLKVFAAFGFVLREQAFEIESAVLKRLRARQLNGEWLDATPIQVRDAAQEAITRAALKPLMWGDRVERKTTAQAVRARNAMDEYRKLREG